ncbi:sensor histidine kinase [Chitinophaga silvatica]|nr:HAMP domain-containing sensor histidine kinase [Chitinophaga silvatica]
MSKLLSKPFKAFSIYALIILAASIPVYYWVVDHIWKSELDEHNLIIKERIEKNATNERFDIQQIEAVLDIWNALEPGARLYPVPATAVRPDSIYTIYRKRDFGSDKQIDRFRGLSSFLTVHGKTYHLEIETNIEETEEIILAIAIVTTFFFLMLVVGFIILNRNISQRIWSPFRKTLEKLQAFDLTANQELHLGSSEIEEFSALNSAIDKLIENNISVFNEQRRFLENASHELQTPLAILKSKIDLLLQTKDITQDQSQLLNDIEIPMARVSRISKNLLLLAKIENKQFQDTTQISIADIVNESLDLLIEYLEDKKLILTENITPGVKVSANKFLLETLINNLLINAIRHTPANGQITINLFNNSLEIKNTGTAPLDAEKLFKRFAISSKDSINSGLGLAIVKEITLRYQWKIIYSFKDEMHRFSVEF